MIYIYTYIYITQGCTHIYHYDEIMMTCIILLQAPDLVASDVFPLRLCGPLAAFKTDMQVANMYLVNQGIVHDCS